MAEWYSIAYMYHYAKWSKSEKQILYINAYTWNLEKLNWWTYFQGRNGDEDIENRLVDTVRGGGETGMNGKSSIKIYTLSYVK